MSFFFSYGIVCAAGKAAIRPKQQNWQALEWAREEMKGDREVCKAVVPQAWCCRGVPSRRHVAPGGNVCLWSAEPRLLEILLRKLDHHLKLS